MAERVVRNVEQDYLMCSICLGRYSEPRLLPCGHTFCKQCLEDHIRKTVSNRNSRFFACPVDRVQIPCPAQNMVPAEWARLFPVDTFLTGILQTVNLHQSSNEEQEVAEIGLCTNHNGRVLEFYCLACKVMACSYCVVKSHKKAVCDCVTADEATEKLKPQIESVKQKLNRLKETARKMLNGEIQDEGFTKSKDRAYYLLNSLEGKVNRFFESAVRSISEMRHQVREARAGQAVEKQHISRVLKNINTTIQTFENVCSQGTGADILGMLPKMMSEADEYNAAVETSRQSSVSYQLNFIPNNTLEDFLLNVNSFGSVRVTGRGIADLQETSTSGAASQDLPHGACPQQRAKLTLSVKNAMEFTSTWQLTGAAFVGECLILVDSYNNKLRQCNYTKSLSVRHQIAMDCPVNLTSLASSTDVAVTQPNKNFITFVSTGNRLEVKNSIVTGKQYEGICNYADRTLLVSCCITGYQCVDVIDYSGQILRTIQKDCTGEDIFTLPKFIAATTSGKILVSDREKRQLICLTLDTEARVHWGYGTPAAPWGVTCDTNGKIYLCLEDNVVQSLTEEGTLVDNRFITAKDEIKIPYAVCASNGHVAVTEWGNNLFAPNSQWVHIFT